ncbi:MAG: PH domain-containing protein [Candidatus Tectomicrobia bacterium]|uniref:PH domain-containing protein n=1 Tax=Tectimicrobiota bacterium TaxID=2528274 RepID=A0A932MNM9_UNCTE|nr:PH domain-containing protein [Candidatus Tectomicrobia bacterium]
MSYMKETLQEGEEVLAQGRMSYKPVLAGLAAAEIVYLGVWIFLRTGFARALGVPEVPVLSGLALNLVLIVPIGLVAALRVFIDRLRNEIVVTDRRVVHRQGIVSRVTEEIDRGAVESVVLSQGVLGRILGYGDVTVRGRGMGDIEVRRIDRPVQFRNSIQGR